MINWLHVQLFCGERTEDGDQQMKMKGIVFAALIMSFGISTAMAQSCESKAVSAEGKPLHGAAKNSFMAKCKRTA